MSNLDSAAATGLPVECLLAFPSGKAISQPGREAEQLDKAASMLAAAVLRVMVEYRDRSRSMPLSEAFWRAAEVVSDHFDRGGVSFQTILAAADFLADAMEARRGVRS